MDTFELSNRRYLGSKAKLVQSISFIAEDLFGYDSQLSVCDAFAGTGVVGAEFLKKGFRVHFNDLLNSNTMIHRAFFDQRPADMQKVAALIDELNGLENFPDSNYFFETFAGTYFNADSALRIGAIREIIEAWFESGRITSLESDILVASLIYAADKVAHTVGHYDAYRTGVDETQQPILLRPLARLTDHAGATFSSDDANNIVRNLPSNILYLDPPYNSRQYSDMYHVLENLANWKKPEVFHKARKMDRKPLKSRYSTKSALSAFVDLVANANSEVIVFSYNDMGKSGEGRSAARLSDEEIFGVLAGHGKTTILELEHQAFQTGKSSKGFVLERLFISDSRSQKVSKTRRASRDELISSPLNYVGGKKSLVPALKQAFGSLHEHTFVDAFAGGLSVSMNVRAADYVINDSSRVPILLASYFHRVPPREIENSVDAIIKEFGLSNSFLNGYSAYGCNSSGGLGAYNKTQYLELRDAYNSSNSWESEDEEAAMLFALVLFSFNNQIRFNSKGEWNMPVGKRDFNAAARRNLFRTSETLVSMKPNFLNLSYEALEIESIKRPFVYCDPPYLLGLAPYNESTCWSEIEEAALLHWLENLHERSIPFALSNVLEHKGMVNRLLSEWALQHRLTTFKLEKNYRNASYQAKKSPDETVEVLIRNFDIVGGRPEVRK